MKPANVKSHKFKYKALAKLYFFHKDASEHLHTICKKTTKNINF